VAGGATGTGTGAGKRQRDGRVGQGRVKVDVTSGDLSLSSFS